MKSKRLSSEADRKATRQAAEEISGATQIPSHNLLHPGAQVAKPTKTTKRKSKTATQKASPVYDSTALSREAVMREADCRLLVQTHDRSLLSVTHRKLPVPPPRLQGPLRDTDILLGRGTRTAAHPGNRVMRTAVALNKGYYMAADRDEKKVLADCLVAFFESRGARFVEMVQDGNKAAGYQYVEYGRVVEKFMQCLREKIVYKGTGVPPSAYNPKEGVIAIPQAKAIASHLPSSGTTSRKLRKSKSGKAKKKLTKKKSTDKDEYIPNQHLKRKLSMAGGVAAKRRRTTTTSTADQTTTTIKNEPIVSSPVAAPKPPPLKKKTSAKITPVKAITAKPIVRATLVSPEAHITGTTTPLPNITNTSAPSAGDVPWNTVRKGDRLGIYWALDRVYYPCVVENRMHSKAWVLYDDDGERECVDLAHNKFFCLPSGVTPSTTSSIRKTPSTVSPDTSLSKTGSSSDKPSSKQRSKKTITLSGSFKPAAAPAPSLLAYLRRKTAKA